MGLLSLEQQVTGIGDRVVGLEEGHQTQANDRAPQKSLTFMTTGISLSANTLAANGEPRYASRLYLSRH